MAKKIAQSSGKKEKYPYPSLYGSHKVMVVEGETQDLADDKLVVCQDEFGMYVTCRDRLDNGLADSYRNSSLEWRQNHLQYVKGQVLDIIVHPEPITE